MNATPPVVVTADRVFDGTTLVTATHVRIERGLVTAIGGADLVREGDVVVDGAGGTLLPGLIDAHVHLAPACTVLAAHFGVTTLVDQFSQPDLVAAERAEVLAAANSAGPARAGLVSSSIGATAPGGHPTMAYAPFPYVTGPGDAEEFVADRTAEGATHLKVILDDGSGAAMDLPALDEATIRALVRVAHGAGLPVVAHVSTGQGAALVARCGVDALAHVPFVPMGVTDLDEVGEAGTAVIATLSIADGFPAAKGVLPLRADEPLDARLTPAWREELDAQARGWLPPDAPDLGAASANVRELARRGCAILAGTDAPNPGLVYGASLHREMQHLARAGLGAAGALRAATSGPARLFGLRDRGVLRPGARADLVLVDGDPLTDIALTARVRRTWVAGREVDPAGYAGGSAESATLGWLRDSQAKILAAIAQRWPEFAAVAGHGEPIETTGDPRVDDALRALRNPDRDVRQRAAVDLGTVAAPAAATELVARLWTEPDFFVRDTLTWAVTRVADAATPLLQDALTGAAATRTQALHVLSKIKDPATAAAVVPLAADDDPAVAAKARWVLARIGDPRTVPALAAHLGTGDATVRNALTRDLASFGRAAVPCLVAALAGDDVPVRRHAAEVLCRLGAAADSATGALGEALQDADDQVRLSAAMALYGLDTAEALAILTGDAVGDDPRIRAIVRRVMAGSGSGVESGADN